MTLRTSSWSGSTPWMRRIARICEELNEWNFARFDAKLEQRLAQQDSKWERRIAELRADMQVGFARMDEKFAQLETRLTRRMFGFWVAQSATTLALLFGVVKLLK